MYSTSIQNIHTEQTDITSSYIIINTKCLSFLLYELDHITEVFWAGYHEIDEYAVHTTIATIRTYFVFWHKDHNFVAFCLVLNTCLFSLSMTLYVWHLQWGVTFLISSFLLYELDHITKVILNRISGNRRGRTSDLHVTYIAWNIPERYFFCPDTNSSDNGVCCLFVVECTANPFEQYTNQTIQKHW